MPELNAPGLFMMQTMGPNGLNARMIGKAQTMPQLANRLRDQLNRAVVDKTGLTGTYDFVVEFTPDPGSFPGGPGGGPGGPLLGAPRDGPQIPGANDPSGLTLIGALHQQIGLSLHSTKAPLDILIIDRANKVPTENSGPTSPIKRDGPAAHESLAREFQYLTSPVLVFIAAGRYTSRGWNTAQRILRLHPSLFAHSGA